MNIKTVTYKINPPLLNKERFLGLANNRNKLNG